MAGVAASKIRIGQGLLFGTVCLMAALVPLYLPASQHTGTTVRSFPGWPQTWQGQPLIPAALTDIEARFASGFPGKMARFTSGTQAVTLRWVTHPTRRLHPAIDCFKAAGYQIHPLPLRVDSQGTTWSHFRAARWQESFDVFERIYDQQNNSWTDVSAWYWAALLEKTEGPWWSVVKVVRR